MSDRTKQDFTEQPSYGDHCPKCGAWHDLTKACTLPTAETLQHELMVTKGSEKYNAEYARAFELERDDLREEHERVKAELKKAEGQVAFWTGEDAPERNAEITTLRADLEQRTKERDAARDTMRAANRGAETNAHALRLSSERNVKLMDELAAAHAALRQAQEALFALASYGLTVRTDRLDSTKEFALQTVDWCVGLLARAESAADILDKVAPVAGRRPSA